METQLDQIREQQKTTWNKFSPGWRKWDDFTMSWMRPTGEAMIRALELRDTDAVLDIAAGTGEPGLTIAAMVPRGRVVLTDLAEGMLQVAQDKAAQRNLSNVETAECDVSELPFADATFNAISCRFGFMFFPDMRVAAHEMVRVLKPGGRIAAAVWGAPTHNVWVTAIMGTINQHMELPAPPPGAPGMFRCAAPHFLADLFQQVGLQHVTEQAVSGQIPFGSNERYWTFMNEVAAPVVAAMSHADNTMRETIRQQAFELVNQKYPDGKVALDYSAVVVCGTKA